MKRFVFSALASTALACPGFADDLKVEVESPAAPSAEVEVEVPEAESPVIDAVLTPAFDPDAADVVKDVDVTDDGPVDITAVIDDDAVITTMSETQRTDVDDPSIIYFSTTSTTDTSTTSEAPASVNQLADEQRNSLRLFSGREATAEKSGKASNLKDLLAARTAAKAETGAKSSTKLRTDERSAARRKAEIDQLRDKAMRTKDAKLMSQADAMAAAEARSNTKARTFLGLSFGRK